MLPSGQRHAAHPEASIVSEHPALWFRIVPINPIALVNHRAVFSSHLTIEAPTRHFLNGAGWNVIVSPKGLIDLKMGSYLISSSAFGNNFRVNDEV